MTGESLIMLFLGAVAAFTLTYAMWPVVKETRVYHRAWVWLWRRRR
jgi:hypothetical protein